MMHSTFYVACLSLLVSDCFAELSSEYNLVVSANSEELKERIEISAHERLRVLREEWGDPDTAALPYPISIKVSPSNDKASGFSEYYPDLKNVKIEVAGDMRGILDDALPRQLSHLVLAERIGIGPRWAEMGIGLLAESRKARDRNWKAFRNIRDSAELMPLGELLSYSEYPKDADDIKRMYSQSMVIAQYIVETRDRETLVKFALDSKTTDLTSAVKQNLGFETIGEFELAFRNWAAD